MNLDIDSLLLERMFEGVTFLNRKGQITDFNRALRPWLKCCASVAPQPDQLIKQVATGAISASVNGTEIFPPWTNADPVDRLPLQKRPARLSAFGYPSAATGGSTHFER